MYILVISDQSAFSYDLKITTTVLTKDEQSQIQKLLVDIAYWMTQ